ncbi:MAG: glycosyltransferase family 9 protein [Bacteroidales bacterium]|nr:glycosyltransferase family 9 protein [Bacteroidales bacterium]HQP04180.1 glycosyltransferase family 9 protein [Bacteroidales bacterium]
MDSNNIKFLIIRFSSIGDIVLTTPVVRCIKQQIEGAEVHYLTKPQYKFLLEENPYIDKIHVLGRFSETLSQLYDEHFDYIIDLHNNLRSLRFKHRLKVIDFSFHKLNREKLLLTWFKLDKLPDIHIVDRYFATVSLFDVENDGKGLDYFLPENDPKKVHPLLEDLPLVYFVVAIGGQHETKKLPPYKLAELCRLLQYRTILIGGNQDSEAASEIVEMTEGADVTNLCGLISVNDSAALIRHAAVVITHDTGMMHIASAFRKIVFSIWGNTIPKFGMYPYMPDERSKIFQVEGLPCRPCSKLGRKRCPKKHFRCMTEQNVKTVALEANKIAFQC